MISYGVGSHEAISRLRFHVALRNSRLRLTGRHDVFSSMIIHDGFGFVLCPIWVLASSFRFFEAQLFCASLYKKKTPIQVSFCLPGNVLWLRHDFLRGRFTRSDFKVAIPCSLTTFITPSHREARCLFFDDHS